MKFGYLFTDFGSKTKNDGYYILKCLSFIVIDPIYGAMIFDTGSPQDIDNLALQLKKHFDITPSDIKWVFNTHIHPDHLGANSIFKNAKIIFSRKDFEFSQEMAEVAFRDGDLLQFLLDRCPGYKNYFDDFEANQTKYYLKNYWSKEKIGFGLDTAYIEDKPEIPEFIEIIPTPGHTFHHYCYKLNIDNKEIFVTGDAVSNRFILKEDNDFRLQEPHMDFEQYFNSHKIFKNKNCLIVPGHDRPFYPENSNSIRKNCFSKSDIIL